jgi:hypothetical protein
VGGGADDGVSLWRRTCSADTSGVVRISLMIGSSSQRSVGHKLTGSSLAARPGERLRRRGQFNEVDLTLDYTSCPAWAKPIGRHDLTSSRTPAGTRRRKCTGPDRFRAYRRLSDGTTISARSRQLRQIFRSHLWVHQWQDDCYCNLQRVRAWLRDRRLMAIRRGRVTSTDHRFHRPAFCLGKWTLKPVIAYSRCSAISRATAWRQLLGGSSSVSF